MVGCPPVWSAGGAEDEFVAVVKDDEGVGGVGGCGEDDTHGSGVYSFVCFWYLSLYLGPVFGFDLRGREMFYGGGLGLVGRVGVDSGDFKKCGKVRSNGILVCGIGSRAAASGLSWSDGC